MQERDMRVTVVHNYTHNGFKFRLYFGNGDDGIMLPMNAKLTQEYIKSVKHAQSVFNARYDYVREMELEGFANIEKIIADKSCEWGQWEIDHFRESYKRQNRFTSEHKKYSQRNKILERDNYTCQNPFCNYHDVSGNGLHIDHIIPKSRGGSNRMDNLQVLCIDCNRAKFTMTMDEWQLSLIEAQS